MLLWVVAAIVVVSFACAGVGAWVSTQKDRPAAEGLLFGLLLGPIGVLVAVLMPQGPSRRLWGAVAHEQEEPDLSVLEPPPEERPKPRRGWELPRGATEPKPKDQVDPERFRDFKF